MANIKSQIKRNRQNEKARLRNKAVRSEVKTRIKRAEADPTDAEATRKAMSTIDRARSKGVLHPNTAARKKSRLQRRLNAALSEAAGSE